MAVSLINGSSSSFSMESAMREPASGGERAVPKHAHGTINLSGHTSSTAEITDAAMKLFDSIMDKQLLSRRLCICACNVIREDDTSSRRTPEQLDLFDLLEPEEVKAEKAIKAQKEHALQEAMLEIKRKYGKNAVLKVKNLDKGGTAIERNKQIGGHKA